MQIQGDEITPQKRLQQMVGRLKDNNCRITPQRYAVLNVLALSNDHPSVEKFMPNF